MLRLKFDLKAWILFVAGSLLCLALAPTRSVAQEAKEEAAPVAEDQAAVRARNRGKAGIYVQLPRLTPSNGTRKLVASNPLVFAVMLPLWWRDIEPSPREFDFETLKTEIAYWKSRGKKVVLQVTPYGQEPDEVQTPPWLYRRPDVEAISFVGGGDARGARIRVPAVWKTGFVDACMEPMVKALASAVDGDSTIAYIQIGLGHLGNITAQPSKDGSKAFLAAGWTPQTWESYCLHVADLYNTHFKRTPLLAVAEGLLIRNPPTNPATRGYQMEVGRLVGALTRKGVSIIHSDIVDLGAEHLPEIARLIKDHLGGIHFLVANGTVRIGLGDDWPLWVPETRRGPGPTFHHDDSFLQKAIDHAFGGIDGIPHTGMTIYYAQIPEIMASNPLSTKGNARNNFYRPAVQEILERTRDRLLRNDAQVFGSEVDP